MQGLHNDPSPLSGPSAPIPAQHQDWPGSDGELSPRADHGESAYVGAEKLKNKKALITGGDSGIGRAVAIAFAREGADVAIAYFNEHEDAQETLRWVRKAGRKGKAIACDLSRSYQECERVVQEAVEELGGLDILVNNAAVHFECAHFEQIGPNQLEKTFRTNVFAYFWMVQAALAHLQPGSSIINTGSVVGLKGHRTLMDYAATKGAVHNLTHSLAQELAERGIRVNCVAPGPVWTPLIASTRLEEKVEGFGRDSLWERPAQPAELAPSYVFLASSDARYYTGEILAPTGNAFTTR